jgi:hypothetical protein
MAALRRCAGRGKSGLHGGTVPGNARRGRPQGKCHRKYTANPPRHVGRAARVKRCGKSAPRRRQRRRQGKPHREQDQVGAAGIPERSEDAGRAFAPPLGSVARGVRRRAPQRNGHHRPLGNQRAGQNPAYTPSGAATVDPSADQSGITALFRGQPCGRQILSLLLEIDRLAWRRVVDLQGFAAVTWRSGH